MSTSEVPTDIPDIHAINPAPHHTAPAESLYEKIRGMENALSNGFLSQLEQPWIDRRLLMETATKALDGDRSAQQALGEALTSYVKTTGQTLQDFTKSETWQRLADEKMQDIQAIRHAYAQADFESAAQLTGIAIAGMTDLHKNKHHHEHDGAPTAWNDSSRPHHAADSSQDFALSQGETIQIGHRTFTHEDEIEHVHVRAPLRDEDIATIDDHDPLAPRRRKHVAPSQETSGNSTLTNIGIGAVTAAGLGYAGYEAHQHLSHADRQHNLELSVAYKATMQLAEDQSAENRKAFYDISLKKHPELQQAFAGYELVRANLAKDGTLSTQDKGVLDMVVFNTNLYILDGRTQQIRANALEFSDPGHERSYYEEKSAPTR